MKYAINKAGLSRVKYTEWPNEILNQFDFIRKSQKDAFFSYYMDWFGTLGNMDGSNNIVATTRPVYSADDDDEEEE